MTGLQGSTRPTHTMQTTDDSLTRLLESLLERTPGTQHALVVSRDGLKLCWSRHLTLDQADQLAAICSGIQALAQGASVEFGNGNGGVRHSMTEFYGGLLFVVEAGDGAHLAVVAEDGADPGVVGHRMTELVEQMGEPLRAEPPLPSQVEVPAPSSSNGQSPQGH